ncbi:helix-turn-helix domain-containing protein [Chelatococcus sp.]|uniref:helix-turn-helix domain-containing protein n=1 Tax=Chelatococcus sp. TaxID=1953771 RepID=UPI00344F6380
MTRRRCVQIASWVVQIDRETLISPTLKWRTAKARQIGYWLTHRFCGATLNEIGQTFGGRDHTSVLHGIRRVNAVVAHLNLDGLSPEGIAQVLWDADWSAAR